VTFNPAWESEAENWIAWARKPDHDAYWWYAPGFFDGFVPPVAGRTLDLGCGEGRTTRDLAARGHRVTSIDASPTLLAAAAAVDPGGDYRLADAAALPFAEGFFDLVVAYNSLMDVDDMPGSIREAARVVALGGRVCACVTHPLADAGAWESRAADALFTIDGSYFDRRRFGAGPFTRAGLTMTFHSWCYPLEAYARALEEAGLLIESIREPSVPAEDARHGRIPPFLWLRAVKRNPPFASGSPNR
jgi:SAM-dependent methyltransferase